MTIAASLLNKHSPASWRASFGALSKRWEAYTSAEIDLTVSPAEDMFGPAGLPHYLRAGVRALQAISEAMLLGRRTTIQTVLDLPCGGGRVTRHLIKFFPEATIHVCDADKPKEDFVVSHFNLPRFAAPIDFSAEPSKRFDLIFVGSLLTHFDQNVFKAALSYFINALEPDGLLVATLHGRSLAHSVVHRQKELAKKRKGKAPRPELLKSLEENFLVNGFSFLQRQTIGGVPYGVAYSSPSWVLALAEARKDIAILGLHEAGWGRRQDVLVLQKKPPGG